MLLKELQTDCRFMFSDRSTPLAFADRRGSYDAKGTFIYRGVGENACPILQHEETGYRLIAVSGTYYRSVLIIFK
jgi:hypothetical protein